MNTASSYIPTVEQMRFRDYEIILEDLEFMFKKSSLSEIEFMHNRGFSITEIAEHAKRNEYEILLAVLHLHRKGRLKKPLRRI